VEGLLSKNVQAASLLIKPGTDIATVTVLNELPSTSSPDGVLVELGDFYADETRRLVLSLEVPARAALGVAQIAELVFRYVELPGLVEHVVTVPLAVNVLPGDEAAGRVRSPEVEREKLLLTVQKAKRESEEALRHGDRQAAGAAMGAAVALLSAVPLPDAGVLDELTWFEQSIGYLDERDDAFNVKRSMTSRSRAEKGTRDPRRGGEF
jgi:Ca-activated chloride channel family protein